MSHIVDTRRDRCASFAGNQRPDTTVTTDPFVLCGGRSPFPLTLPSSAKHERKRLTHDLGRGAR